MVQGAPQPAPLPPGFAPPIIARLWLPPANRPQERGEGSENMERLGQSQVPARDGQGLRPITEEHASDADQPGGSVGGADGCLRSRRRKRRDPTWRRPRGPGRSAHVRQRSRMGARAEPSASLPGPPGGLRG
ncbi:hypothetical protein NN561_000013 [Cricetulus griseus]